MLKKRINYILIILSILLLVCCTKQKYLNKENLKLPNELKYTTNFYCTSNQKIYLAGSCNNNKLVVWESYDFGKSWKKIIDIYELIKYDTNNEFCQVFFFEDGKIVCEKAHVNINNEVTEIQFYEIDKKNIVNTWTLELQCLENNNINVITELYQVTDNIFVERELGGRCYVHNINKERVEYVYNDEKCLEIGVVDGKIIEIDSDGIYYFDLKTKTKSYINKILLCLPVGDLPDIMSLSL